MNPIIETNIEKITGYKKSQFAPGPGKHAIDETGLENAVQFIIDEMTKENFRHVKKDDVIAYLTATPEPSRPDDISPLQEPSGIPVHTEYDASITKDPLFDEAQLHPVKPPTMQNKYQREIQPDVYVDVYDVLVAWRVTCPATQHAIKKLLQPGQRGHKARLTDLQEAIQSIERAIELPFVG